MAIDPDVETQLVAMNERLVTLENAAPAPRWPVKIVQVHNDGTTVTYTLASVESSDA